MSDVNLYTLDQYVALLGKGHPAIAEYDTIRARVAELEQERRDLLDGIKRLRAALAKREADECAFVHIPTLLVACTRSKLGIAIEEAKAAAGNRRQDMLAAAQQVQP